MKSDGSGGGGGGVVGAVADLLRDGCVGGGSESIICQS